MDTGAGKKRLPVILILCGVLMAVFTVLRLVDLWNDLRGWMPDGLDDGNIVYLIIGAGLAVLAGVSAYGFFRRRRWSLAGTIIVVICNILSLVLIDLPPAEPPYADYAYGALSLITLILAITSLKHLGAKVKTGTEI